MVASLDFVWTIFLKIQFREENAPTFPYHIKANLKIYTFIYINNKNFLCTKMYFSM